jgi:hypothetical protein
MYAGVDTVCTTGNKLSHYLRAKVLDGGRNVRVQSDGAYPKILLGAGLPIPPVAPPKVSLVF